MQLLCTGCTHTLRSSVRAGRDRNPFFVRLAGPRRAVLLPQAMLFSEEGPVFQQACLGYGHAAATLTSEELYCLARGPAGRVGPLSAIGSHDGSRDRDAYFRPVSVAVVRALV
jgi:hypothetical protein